MISKAVALPLYALSGAVWGVVAWLFGAKAFGEAIWAGVIASPFVGVAVGLTMQRWFEQSLPGRRKLIAFLSLYLGVALFGFATGIWDWWPGGHQSVLSSLGEGIGTALYGVTVGGFFILFWPLAYLTHIILAAASRTPLPSSG